MPRKTPESIRAALLNDPNTAKIAEKLKVEVEDYIKLVVHYATTGAEPQLMVVPDAELKKAGHKVPDQREMKKFFVEAIAVKKAREATDYSPPKAKLVSF